MIKTIDNCYFNKIIYYGKVKLMINCHIPYTSIYLKNYHNLKIKMKLEQDTTNNYMLNAKFTSSPTGKEMLS
jgi:hypothetical protein